MRRSIGLPAWLMAASIAVAACGSGGTSPSAGASAAASSAASAAASSGASTQPSSAASGAPASTAASPAASPAASTGGGATGPCDLITTDEVASALGVSGVTSTPSDGVVAYCMYNAGADIAAATSWTKSGGSVAFGAFAQEAGAIQVPGIGDQAVFSPSTETLFILKGDAVVGITAGQGDAGAAKRQEWATALGKLAAGRM